MPRRSTDWTGQPLIYGYCRLCGQSTAASNKICEDCYARKDPRIEVITGKRCACGTEAVCQCGKCGHGVCEQHRHTLTPSGTENRCAKCLQEEKVETAQLHRLNWFQAHCRTCGKYSEQLQEVESKLLGKVLLCPDCVQKAGLQARPK